MQATAETYSQNQGINETILWLLAQGYPALPIAPQNEQIVFKGKQLFTGKNPSYLNRLAQAIVVPHQPYQHKLPTSEELKRWFHHPSVGVATLGGWQSTLWLDIDSKHFASRLCCEMVVQEYLERTPILKASYCERTQSGGYHIAFRCDELPTFTNCSLNTGQKLGQLLGAGRVCVLAPTKGPDGWYKTVQKTRPRWVTSLEALSLQPTQKPQASTPVVHQTNQLLGSNDVSFQRVCSQRVKALMALDTVAVGQRSDLLVVIAREAFGWEQFTAELNLSINPNAEALCFELGSRWGLDGDRIRRILNSSSCGIPVRQSLPSLFLTSGYDPCWRWLRRCCR